MNKNDFLKELGKHLDILEDKEQEDILDEYAQHIDMKISNGLSEEEATGDFGSISELASQILEAYHVKPEYKKTKVNKRTVDVSKAADEGKKVWSLIAGFFNKLLLLLKRFGKACFTFMKAAGRQVIGILSLPVKYIKELLTKKQASAPDISVKKQSTGRKSLNTKKAMYSFKSGIHSFGDFLKQCIIFVFHCIAWCIRWSWNLCLLFVSLMSGLFTLGLLFAFAFSIVLMFQDYPVVGITLILLGTVICGFAFTMFCTTLLLLEKGETDIVQSEPEVAEYKAEEVYHA